MVHGAHNLDGYKKNYRARLKFFCKNEVNTAIMTVNSRQNGLNCKYINILSCNPTFALGSEQESTNVAISS